ncbi:related to SRO77 - polarized exocytosis by regulating SNARE function [Cephalotrichum gorgonifer]|uniref:Related to SRO77 - polarized exocytosis by regulating SNARE function n=1 Tax=Cephalotrichum gorgonifer TaxID=2041049 RepID=A0AAE8N5J7_9PEZI|nr:related to SRO77 - polarized exocytosis by regulating SNARE function [Cephalotrichum gorgonifer]
MASFLRGKQTGMQKDLSAGIASSDFNPDDLARYGINSQISCLAYDPVQSLLAVGTNETKFGPGKIYIFGQRRVQKTIDPPRPTSFRELRFASGGRLVSLDARSELSVWDLDTATRVAGGVAPGGAVCLETDPMLDWALLGSSVGDVLAYDLDRGRMANGFRLPNFWRERDSSARQVALVDVAFHPRDIGKLLISYTHGAVIYSIKQARVQHFLEYVVPRGAPGGRGLATDTARSPRLTHAKWHPSGTFVLTAHDDGSLAFWDASQGKLLMARTLTDLNVDQPARREVAARVVTPFSRISWCCKENPDDTGLLIAGGQSTDDPQQGLTFIDLGPTPIYATSSWQALSDHFAGRRRISLPLPPGVQVEQYQLIPRSSPHFGGAQDPIAIITLLTSGELVTLSFPSGHPISPTNQLHPSLSLVHPFVTNIAAATLERTRWLGMVENRSIGDPILTGGAEASKPKRKYDSRTILQVAHADGTIRIWDSGHGDDIENDAQLQVDVARAVARYDSVEVSAMSMASTTGEFVAGTTAGEVVVYRWGPNPLYGRDEMGPPHDPNPGGLTDITSRAEPPLRLGLQPFTLYEMAKGPITAVAVCDVGFVAAGSEGGGLSIIDLRGPRIIYQASMSEFAKQEKRTSFLKGHSTPTQKEWPVEIKFGVMTLEGDNYSSIACFVGTNTGKVITLKLLPSGEGYAVKVAGVVSFGDSVVSISPIVADTGKPAAATGPVVAGLRNGQQVNGVLVVVTKTEIRIFKPASSKGASKSFDDVLCDAASVTELDYRGTVVAAVLGDGSTRAYTIPALREIAKAQLPPLDPTRRSATLFTENGYIFGWVGPSELALLHAWGFGERLQNSADVVVNPDLATPQRPTISNLQWISGTQYVSPTDLDLLIGGPDRPPSKRMLEAAAAEQRSARAGAAAASAAGGSEEGWGSYLTRQLNERTEKLNIMGDSMDQLQNQTQGWADDVDRVVRQQKRNMLIGGIKGKFM